MTNECAEYLNATAGRWDKAKSDAAIAKIESKVYAVTAVDCGDSCDGHPSCLGLFKNKAVAKAYVRNDMEARCDNLAGCDIRVDFDRMEILNSCDDPIYMWSIDFVEVK